MNKAIIYILLVLFISSACKKTRTCSCTVSGTTVKTSIPRNGGSSTVQTSQSSYTTEETQGSITKKEMRRSKNCNTISISSIESYTQSVSSDTTTVVNDVTAETSTEFNCTIE